MCNCNESIFSIFWNFDWVKISSIFLIIGGIYAILQYRQSVKNSSYGVYHTIKNEIYGEESKVMSKAIRNNNIEYHDNNEKPILRFKDNKENINIDLLHNLEDLYLYYEDGLISKKYIMYGFSLLIIKVKENKEVEKFIIALRKKENDPKLYFGIDRLYDLVKTSQTK